MKKLLLSFGTLTTVIVPICTIISCDDESSALTNNVDVLAITQNPQSQSGEVKPESPNSKDLEIVHNKNQKIARLKTGTGHISKKNKSLASYTDSEKGGTASIILHNEEPVKPQIVKDNGVISKGFNIKDNGIFVLDVNDNPTRKESEILDVYSKFTKEINFKASENGVYGMLNTLNKVTEVDKAKKYIKIMIIGHRNDGVEVYFCGVMGYEANSSSLDFLFREFTDESEIGDSASVGNFLKLKMNPPATDPSPSIPLMDMNKDIKIIVKFLVKVAEQEFPDAIVNLY